MERLLKLKLSRRSFLAQAFAVCTGFWIANNDSRQQEAILNQQLIPTRSEITDVTVAINNFRVAIDWMNAFDNPQVQEVAQELLHLFDQSQAGIAQKVGFIESGQLLKKDVSVTTLIVDGHRQIQIVLSAREFSRENFSPQQTGRSLYEAYFIFQKAEDNPERYSIDSTFRDNLARDAKEITSKIFLSDRID